MHSSTLCTTLTTPLTLLQIIFYLLYDSIAMIGTSDQSCWLAEACKILLLLLLLENLVSLVIGILTGIFWELHHSRFDQIPAAFSDT